MFAMFRSTVRLSKGYYNKCSIFTSSLQSQDPVLCNLLYKEYDRQKKSIELIASENFTSKAVMQCLGSIATNKYSEGRPGKRYYGGNEVIDQIENLCEERALDVFKLNSSEWGVNVQLYSGSIANISVYAGLLKPNDCLMGLDLPSGGHLSHGFFTSKRKIHLSSQIYNSVPYKIKEDGFVDYEDLEMKALEHKPKLIVCGGSAYPRDWEYDTLRTIANKVNAYLMCDMSHYSGLVATDICKNPFDYVDVVATTTHKTFRGPRAGMIFSKKHLSGKINQSVFPGIQGGPHNHQIAAIATQLFQMQKPEYAEYCTNVVSNAKTLANELNQLGYNISTNGTDTHMILVDLKNKNITGDKVELVCEKVGISINKNTLYGDTSALYPSGIRLGTSAMTSRGLSKFGFKKVAKLIDKCVMLGVKFQRRYPDSSFKEVINTKDATIEIGNVKNEIHHLLKELEFYNDPF